jgi:hypothetical protein
MTLAIATIVLKLAALYLGAGLAFAVAFVLFGVARIDPTSRGAPVGFRLIILPGVTLLWPLLAWRWVRATR